MPACKATGASPTPKLTAPADSVNPGTRSLLPLRQALQQWLRQHGVSPPDAQAPLAIAYSGGLDSTVLLRVAHSLWPGAVVAIHINHGLQTAATGFESHCAATCHQLGVPLSVMRANICLKPGDSLEEQARDARYALLVQAASALGARVVWLAQHADDQAETIMLALSRGAGVSGLAGMADFTVNSSLIFGRPLLALPQARLRALAQAQGWDFVDDPTNHDTRRTRNRIRHDVMPALLQAFPQIVVTLTRSARHCAQADDLLVDLARLDLQAVGVPPGLRTLQSLTVPRLGNVLRCWLRDTAGRAPSTAQLSELVKQIAAATTRGHDIDIKVGDGRVVREGHHLAYVPPLSPTDSEAKEHGQNEA